MRDTIQQFMWGYQSHFRYSLGRLAVHALESIGVYAAPESLLVGFQETGQSEWSICIEPEGRGYEPELFANVEAEADAQMLIHPDKDVFHSLQKVHDAMIRRRLEGCRSDLMALALANSEAGKDRTFFVGFPRIVGDYRVYPVISVLSSRWDGYPRLKHDQSDGRIHTIESLQRAVVASVLSQGTRDLDRLTPPEELSDWPHRLSPQVVRSAVGAFVASLVAVHGSWEGTEFADAMDAVAAQPYEGRAAFGTLILGNPGSEDVQFELRLSEAVRVGESRSFRKLLEMTGPGHSLVTDGSSLLGLGVVSETYDPDSEKLYTVLVLGRGSWELRHQDIPLLRMDNGEAKLPAERISRQQFVDTVRRTLGEASDGEALWQQVLSAARQQHGTMIVVHRDAVEEARRLQSQATLVANQKLSPSALNSVTAIDGAVLLLPDATCVAVGVILDGVASPGVGDRARGARYNSGVRYQISAPQKSCVVVIISEDGMINLLPQLPRRVKRSSVDAAVTLLEEAARGDVDFEIATAAAEYAESLAFYMTAEQCERVNAAREAIEVARGKSGSAFTRVGFDLLQPASEMDESYFLEDQ